MNTVLVILFVIVLGTAELPERFVQRAADSLKPLATSYLNAIRKEARDPDRLADQMARKTVRKLYNILRWVTLRGEADRSSGEADRIHGDSMTTKKPSLLDQMTVTERQLACAILLAQADKLRKGDPKRLELLQAAKQLLDRKAPQ